MKAITHMLDDEYDIYCCVTSFMNVPFTWSKYWIDPGKREVMNWNAAVAKLLAVPGLVLMSYPEK